ncbi:unnamed protein product [Strongylus vulgaris]|uniref:Uncharacterized protein n=1 Tax=Strongylus vulgaris TaxID=40348 RepID=A0A3P7KCR6_STRVU|nr:unnamed protein product [Strongylus vulgaris]
MSYLRMLVLLKSIQSVYIADRVSEVRKEAVHLLSQILARLVDYEWSNITTKQESSVDAPSGATLTELFVHDLVSDVINVRIAVCRALSLCDSTVQSDAIASDSRGQSPLTVETVLERLAEDSDMDVARAARQAMGRTIGSETVDISMRGFRIREKENSLLDAQMIDNYEEDDMSLCSDYATSETSIRSTQLAHHE